MALAYDDEQAWHLYTSMCARYSVTVVDDAQPFDTLAALRQEAQVVAGALETQRRRLRHECVAPSVRAATDCDDCSQCRVCVYKRRRRAARQ